MYSNHKKTINPSKSPYPLSKLHPPESPLNGRRVKSSNNSRAEIGNYANRSSTSKTVSASCYLQKPHADLLRHRQQLLRDYRSIMRKRLAAIDNCIRFVFLHFSHQRTIILKELTKFSQKKEEEFAESIATNSELLVSKVSHVLKQYEKESGIENLAKYCLSGKLGRPVASKDVLEEAYRQIRERVAQETKDLDAQLFNINLDEDEEQTTIKRVKESVHLLEIGFKEAVEGFRLQMEKNILNIPSSDTGVQFVAPRSNKPQQSNVNDELLTFGKLSKLKIAHELKHDQNFRIASLLVPIKSNYSLPNICAIIGGEDGTLSLVKEVDEGIRSYPFWEQFSGRINCIIELEASDINTKNIAIGIKDPHQIAILSISENTTEVFKSNIFEAPITSISQFEMDSSKILVGTLDGMLRILIKNTRGDLTQDSMINAHDGEISFISSQNNLIITIGVDKKLRFWDAKDGPHFIRLLDIELKDPVTAILSTSNSELVFLDQSGLLKKIDTRLATLGQIKSYCQLSKTKINRGSLSYSQSENKILAISEDMLWLIDKTSFEIKAKKLPKSPLQFAVPIPNNQRGPKIVCATETEIVILECM